MPVHRIAKRSGHLLADAGASPNTVGIVANTDGPVASRAGTAVGLEYCSDGLTIQHLADGFWGLKTIVDGSATPLFDVACAAGSISGGNIEFLVEASDGTDFQGLSGFATYAMVNKAGTNTLQFTYATANDAKAVSSGTLTLAFTFVTGTNKGTVKLQPTGSLTETAPYRITYFVTPIKGAVTIL